MIREDYYASINPAFCSIILCNFVSKYYEKSSSFPTYPTMLLPIPLVLSGDFNDFFKYKRSDSDFLTLLRDNQFISLLIQERIKNTLQISQNAFAFSFSVNALFFDNESNTFMTTENTDYALTPRGGTLKQFAAKSKLLGTWLGRIGCEATIYNQLGIL